MRKLCDLRPWLTVNTYPKKVMCHYMGVSV